MSIAMSNERFWQEVFIAATRSGSNYDNAIYKADKALEYYKLSKTL